jgi:hypothetical protein
MILGYIVAVHGDGKGGPPFYTSYLKGFGGKQVDCHRLFPVAAQDDHPPCVRPSPIPLFFQGLLIQKGQKGEERVSQADVWDGQDRSAAAFGKQETWKLFSDAKRQALQLSEALIQHQENPHEKNVTSEVTEAYYAVARGRRFDSFGIYADVNKFLLEVNGVVGSLFKVCESYSEAHLYLKKHFINEHPAPSNVASADSPPSFTEVDSLSPSVPPGENRRDLFKASMLDLGGRSMTWDQSKGKEGKIFGYSVLDTVKLRNGLVPDP